MCVYVFPVDLNVSEKYMNPVVFSKLVYMCVFTETILPFSKKENKKTAQVHSQSSAEGNLRQRYCSVSTGVIPQRLHFVAEK